MENKVKLGLFFMMVAAGVIGLLWTSLFAGLPGAGENIIPREASKWHLGKGSEYNQTMLYAITTDKIKFSVKIGFFSDQSGKQMVLVEINDPNNSKKISQRVSVSSPFTLGEVSDEAKPYFKTLDETIFSVRDFALEEKYLVKKAVWGTVFVGQVPQEITVRDHGKFSFEFGSATAFIVSYDIGNKENKLWIVDNLPLPVKAEIYDFDGNLRYSYELTSLQAPLTPGFS